MQAIVALILIPVYFMFFFLFGQGFYKVLGVKGRSIGHKIIIGFFVYFSLFQLVALPLKITLQPLSMLSSIWAVCVIIIVISVSAVVIKEKLIEQESKKRRKPQKGIFSKKDLYYVIAIIAIVLIQFFIIELNQRVGSPLDASYYIGEVVSSVYTNTIAQYDAYTGMKLNVLNSSYLLENYQMHSAVSSQLFHIHPLLEMRTTMTGVVVILTNVVLTCFAKMLFHKNIKKMTLFLLFIAIINVCYASWYSASLFYFNRTFEGKAILSSMIFPAIFYVIFRIMKSHDNNQKTKVRVEWIELFVLVFGTFCINMSAMFLVPVLLSALLIPFAFMKRSWVIFRNYVISLIPCILVIGYYVMTSFGYGLFFIK